MITNISLRVLARMFGRLSSGAIRPAPSSRRRALISLGLGAIAVLALPALAAVRASLATDFAQPSASTVLADGGNPQPVHLVRPPAGPLSVMAELGRSVFYDAALSSSGKLSCASCHSPDHAYAAPNDLPAMLGGPDLSRQGVRAVPSLKYLERNPAFSIGPDDDKLESVSLAQQVASSLDAPRALKTAAQTDKSAANLVPQGGLFWDGRAGSLQDQATFPLLDPREMNGGSIEIVAEKLRHAPYADHMLQLFGSTVFNDTRFAVAEAMFAVGRYQIEEPSFHPYTSKFDAWLEGKARFTPGEWRGYLLFNDTAKANCGGCHVDQPTPDGRPPLFTDHQYEALGVPRNDALEVNKNPAYFDLGICGPYRTDMSDQTQYCAMFTTPTLRNVTMRRVFFHNGVYRTLKEVMDFYNFRDTDPEKIYPRVNGVVRKFNDVPTQYHDNVDVTDPPLDRHAGDTPANTARDEEDIIEFIKTLNDGYDGR